MEIANVAGYPAARTDPFHPLVQVVKKSGDEVWDKPMIVYPMTIASGPIYLFARSMPCAGIGTGHANSKIHAPNENIFVEDFWYGAQHVANLIASI